MRNDQLILLIPMLANKVSLESIKETLHISLSQILRAGAKYEKEILHIRELFNSTYEQGESKGIEEAVFQIDKLSYYAERQGDAVTHTYLEMLNTKLSSLESSPPTSEQSRDFKALIKQIYTEDSYWRAHGKKQELAKLLKCSTKTVERATKDIDITLKHEALKELKEGVDIGLVCDRYNIHPLTLNRWIENR